MMGSKVKVTETFAGEGEPIDDLPSRTHCITDRPTVTSTAALSAALDLGISETSYACL